MVVVRSFILSAVGLAALAIAPAAYAEVLASSNFTTDTSTTNTNASRFVFNGDGTMTAKIDTAQPTAKLVYNFAGGKHLTQSDAFKITSTFKITNLVADPNGFAQIAFGLINSTTTGNDRSGGAGGGVSTGDAFDIVNFDYFANIGPLGGPSLQPTIITSNTGSDTMFGNVVATFGAETAMDNAGESPLPVNAFLTAEMIFNPGSRVLTLRVLNESGNALEINKVGAGNVAGGFDGDTTTIQTNLPAGKGFDVDAFAVLAWTDSWGAFDFGAGTFNPQSLAADVIYDSFSVEAIPEPASIGVLAIGAMALLRRRR